MTTSQNFSRRTLLRAGGMSLALPALRAMQDTAQYGISALIDGSAMVRISPGEFTMGSPNGNLDEHPHRVRITHGFEIGKFEVTQVQWETVMKNPHENPGGSVNPSHFGGSTLPVENVSWFDVEKFFVRLNARDDTHEYRLPTEAEWEYACKAGTAADSPKNLDRVAWYKRTSGEQTKPVGEKDANAWGLHDTLGNVAEWVHDWYAPDYYDRSPLADPKGPVTGSYRVFRGGCWFDEAKNCRAAHRGFDFPISQFYNVGFRVVRTPKG